MILGIYARKAPIQALDLDAAIADWTRGGERAVERFEAERFLGFSGGPDEASSLPAARDGGKIALATGHARSATAGSLAARLARLADVERPPEEVRGSFAFAVYAEAQHRLQLGADGFGFQPLFIAETDELFAVCSEYEPLLALPGVSAELDPDAVAEYYLFGMTLGNKTLTRGVRMLPAGVILTVTADGVTSRIHDPLAVPVDHSASIEDHARRVGEVFRETVRATADAFPKATFSLTGGADTRLILSALEPRQRRRHRFETHYGEAQEVDRDRDVVIARKLADQAELRHEARFIDGGHADFEPETFAVHRAKNLGPRGIHGVLGGEYLGGCCVDVALFPVGDVTREAVDRKLRQVFSPGFIERLSVHPHDTLRAEFEGIRAENAEFMFWVNGFARPFFTQLYFGTAGVQTNTWMVPWQMHQRVVSPFADPDFLRALLAVPFEHLSGYHLYNEIYRHVFPEFTGVPTNSGLAVRSDSALTMFTDGAEPKKVRLTRTTSSRARAVERIAARDGVWDRGMYARESLEAAVRDEVRDDEGGPSAMARLKDLYTRSFVFKARRVLPVHDLLMKLKARRETAQAAELHSALAPAFVDFESWCTYAGAEPARTLPELARP